MPRSTIPRALQHPQPRPPTITASLGYYRARLARARRERDEAFAAMAAPGNEANDMAWEARRYRAANADIEALTAHILACEGEARARSLGLHKNVGRRVS